MPLYRYIDIPKKTHFFVPLPRRICVVATGLVPPP